MRWRISSFRTSAISISQNNWKPPADIFVSKVCPVRQHSGTADSAHFNYRDGHRGNGEYGALYRNSGRRALYCEDERRTAKWYTVVLAAADSNRSSHETLISASCVTEASALERHTP